MEKGIIIILLLISGVFTLNGQVNSVQAKINAIQSDSYMKNASIGFYAVNIATGEEIAKLNENTSLTPASIMKLFTTSTAIQTLGAGHQIKTELLHDGFVDSNGVLHGNIYIKGYGDPSLGSRFFTKEGHELDFLKTWVDTIKSFGIKEVDGYVIADGSYFSYDGVPGGWNWTDMGNYYGSGPAGLNIFDNMVYLHFATGAKSGDSTVLHCIEPHIPDLEYREMK
ncbi:MAG: D-alanyl-D-alanine carboxypeptidase [Crocinitomicaceae bacterium]